MIEQTKENKGDLIAKREKLKSQYKLMDEND